MPGFASLMLGFSSGGALLYLLQALGVAVLVFVVVLLLTSHMRFERMNLLLKDRSGADLEPIDAFSVKLADRLGRGLREPEPLVVMMVGRGQDAPGDERVSWAPRVRKEVRRADAVRSCGPARCGLLLEARREHATAIARRVMSALPSPEDVTPPLHIGLVTSPENGSSGAELMVALVAATEEAAHHEQGLYLADGERVSRDLETTSHVESEPGRRTHRMLDDLTGVLRAERLAGALQKFIAKRRRDGVPVAVVCMGLDLSSRIDEHYGRDGMRAVLKGVARLLDTHIRVTDVIGRRGEHHLVMGLECASSSALRLVDRLTELVNQEVFDVGENKVKAKIVCGIAGYPDHGGTPRVLLEAAKTALAVAEEERIGQKVYNESMHTAKAVENQPLDSL